MKRIATLLLFFSLPIIPLPKWVFGVALQGDGTTNVQIDKVGEKSGAELAGLQSGDILISINGKSFTGKNHIEAAALLKAQPDKNNKLKFIRNGKEMEVVINKTPIQIMQGSAACLSGDCLDGKGKLQRKDNVNYIYEGYFKNGKWNGKGVIIYSPPYPVLEVGNHPEGNMTIVKFDGTFSDGKFNGGDIYVKNNKGERKLNGKLNSDNRLDGKYLSTTLSTGKKEYLVFNNGQFDHSEFFDDGKKKPVTASSQPEPAKNNTTSFKKTLKLPREVIDDGFKGFFTIVFTAVTADSVCFNWSVAEISEPLQKGSVKIGKSAIGSATKFESEFLKDNGKKFTSIQNGGNLLLSNSVVKQLIANQPADIQFLPDAKFKCKIIKENKFRLSPEDAKTFITQYECADENEMTFSFINNYNIPIVTGIRIRTATFSLMSIKL